MRTPDSLFSLLIVAFWTVTGDGVSGRYTPERRRDHE
jgi:hypothetical protein